MDTDQEKAWAGVHGDEYNRRSPGNEMANYHLFKKALFSAGHIESVVELGAGQGANIRALARLLPGCDFAAVELNQVAANVLGNTTPCSRVFNQSVLDWEPSRTWDLALTKGLLIHINPEHLCMAYEVLHRAAGRWILTVEYYNPSPVNIPYRGREDLLWKRDFAGELLEKYTDLRLVDYGFVYHRDAAPQDDVTWFLMEKVKASVAAANVAWPFTANARAT